jgi:DNA-directed RNA polymerase specialized sigma24 family protein
LPAQTRSVIWLYHVEGYTHPEIAEMLGKTVSFSKSQVARGTAKLRSLLTSETETGTCATFQANMA